MKDPVETFPPTADSGFLKAEALLCAPEGSSYMRKASCRSEFILNTQEKMYFANMSFVSCLLCWMCMLVSVVFARGHHLC